MKSSQDLWYFKPSLYPSSNPDQGSDDRYVTDDVSKSQYPELKIFFFFLK